MITENIGFRDYIRITACRDTYIVEGTVIFVSAQGLCLQTSSDHVLFIHAGFFDESVKVNIIQKSDVEGTMEDVWKMIPSGQEMLNTVKTNDYLVIDDGYNWPNGDKHVFKGYVTGITYGGMYIYRCNRPNSSLYYHFKSFDEDKTSVIFIRKSNNQEN